MHSGATKRQKELMRKQHQQEKEARKVERKVQSDKKREAGKEAGADPDIADIIPGPQPPIEW
jgi:hypothetical protein